MFIELIQNAALLVTLSVLYGLLARYQKKNSTPFLILSGILFSSMAIAGMNMPMHYGSGIIYDGRSIILVLSGLFGGGIVSVITIVLTGLYRIYLGGVGTIAGVSTIILCGITGIFFRFRYKNKPEDISVIQLWVIGFIAHILMLLAQLLLPWPMGLEIILKIGIPVLLIFPTTTLVIALFLRSEMSRTVMLVKIKQSEEQYKYLFENNPMPMWIYDLDSLAFLKVNQAAQKKYGYSADEFRQLNLKDIRPQEDIQELIEDINTTNSAINDAGVWRHQKKNGEIIYVEITSHLIEYENSKARLVLSYDVSKRINAMQALSASEANYRNLFENHSAVKLMIDPQDGKIINANSAAAQYYGWTVDQLKTMSVDQINVLEKDQLTNEFKCAPDQKNIHLEFKQRLNNSAIRDVEVFASNIKFEGKDCLHSIILDVTEKKEAEKQLKLLSKAIEQSPVSIVITDPSGVIEYINPKFTEITGYQFEDAVGQKPKILKSGEHPQQFYDELWSTINSGKKWAGEIKNKKKNDELYWESEIISPITDKSGNITNFVGVKEDITERKKMLQEVIEAKEKAEEAERLKTAFLANMSHEIRTPLNAILGFTNMLITEDELSPETKTDFTSIVNKSAEGLLQIINDILDASKLETGQVRIYKSPFQLTPFLETLHTQYRKKLDENELDHVELKIVLPTTPFSINTDENRLFQIFSNLLSNSLKFTKTGYISFGVSKILEDRIELFVSDTGIGISQKDQKTIFERFRQVDGDYTRSFGGNGLGLSIVKNLLELMGGKIILESEEEKGTTFLFHLPI